MRQNDFILPNDEQCDQIPISGSKLVLQDFFGDWSLLRILNSSTQTSIACDREANVRFSTISSTKAIVSSGSVKDTLILRRGILSGKVGHVLSIRPTHAVLVGRNPDRRTKNEPRLTTSEAAANQRSDAVNTTVSTASTGTEKASRLPTYYTTRFPSILLGLGTGHLRRRL